MSKVTATWRVSGGFVISERWLEHPFHLSFILSFFNLFLWLYSNTLSDCVKCCYWKCLSGVSAWDFLTCIGKNLNLYFLRFFLVYFFLLYYELPITMNWMPTFLSYIIALSLLGSFKIYYKVCLRDWEHLKKLKIILAKKQIKRIKNYRFVLWSKNYTRCRW